ncbi:hypothetical protein WG66_006065 [Moniliophthora roreri]|nr:hypothetical protein WG66_006065 [Moniliophthora roreri]
MCLLSWVSCLAVRQHGHSRMPTLTIPNAIFQLLAVSRTSTKPGVIASTKKNWHSISAKQPSIETLGLLAISARIIAVGILSSTWSAKLVRHSQGSSAIPCTPARSCPCLTTRVLIQSRSRGGYHRDRLWDRCLCVVTALRKGVAGTNGIASPLAVVDFDDSSLNVFHQLGLREEACGGRGTRKRLRSRKIPCRYSAVGVGVIKMIKGKKGGVPEYSN